MTTQRTRMRMLAVIGTAALLAGCGTQAKTQEKVTAEKAASDPLEITVRPDLLKRVRVGAPEWANVAGKLRVSGRVEADGTRLARVSAPVTGRITEVLAVDGQHVTRGQVLATVYSSELSAAQSDYLKSLSQRQVADRAVTRARQLLEAGVIGSAELQRREAELQQAGAEVSAGRERLKVLGLSDEDLKSLEAERAIHSVTHIVASIDGIVLERKASPGQVVEAVAPVFTIGDLSHVWLVADVPEQSAGNIQVGKEAEAEVPSLQGRAFRGRITFVSAMVNPETRTVQVRMSLPNTDRALKPSMLTTMTLIDGSTRHLIVPESAVVRDENADCVFVETGPSKYKLRTVKLGEDSGTERVVLEGLKPEERVVLEGAFHLNNERRRMAVGGGEGS